MNITSKKISLFILAVTSILFSRTMFLFLDDPEGPNLLVVVGIAAMIYVLALVIYVPKSLPFLTKVVNRLLLAVFVQILVAICLYVSLK